MTEVREKQKFKIVKKEEEQQQIPQKKKHSFAVWYLLLFPLVIIYNEFIFRATTSGEVFGKGTFAMLFFSLSYAMLLYLPLSFIKGGKWLHIATLAVMFLLMLFYTVQSMIYLQFKVYYDLNTIIFGSADAMKSYTAETFRLIFSPQGLLRIALFLLPLILYAIFGLRLFRSRVGNLERRVAALVAFCLCFGLGQVLVHTNEGMRAVYKTEYNYQSAVQNFGLVTGTGLDLKMLLFGRPAEDFVIQEIPVIPSPETPAETVEEGELVTEEAPVEYGNNEMTLKLEETGGEIGQLNQYVSTLTSSKKNAYTGLFKGKNLIFITAEAFSHKVIDPSLTPTLYRLATKGIQFTDYYQPASAGTTGGEYQNIFGMIPTEGGASFKKTATHYNYMTLGSQLNRLGYYGKAFHNNSYTYYSRNETHNNLGYSDGFMGMGNGMENYVSNAWPQSDLEMLQGTLPTYIDKELFNIYYMSVSGHSGYDKSANSQTKKNWEKVENLNYSDAVKGYLAANLELENALAYLVSELENKGIADNTVICISTDHFPYGLDSDAGLGNMPYLSELYGEKVENYFQRDRSALSLWCGSLEKEEPIVVNTPTFSLDILPTLSNLFGTEFDSRLFPGRDVFSDAPALVFNSFYDWKTEYGTYYASKQLFVPKDESVALPEGYVESIKGVVHNKILYCRMALNS
ncbi:MAG: sulfatase-like hydrolase/transferase, partial [Clostridia bacterium]|nr:sulfatase-like hydrolase/transferase [Clostridia bacterium]